jgi:hypothetical protein
MTAREFPTHSLVLTSYLVWRGISPLRMELDGDETVVWVFEWSEDILAARTTLNGGDALVEPFSYNRAHQGVKRRMMEYLREHRASRHARAAS